MLPKDLEYIIYSYLEIHEIIKFPIPDKEYIIYKNFGIINYKNITINNIQLDLCSYMKKPGYSSMFYYTFKYKNNKLTILGPQLFSEYDIYEYDDYKIFECIKYICDFDTELPIFLDVIRNRICDLIVDKDIVRNIKKDNIYHIISKLYKFPKDKITKQIIKGEKPRIYFRLYDNIYDIFIDLNGKKYNREELVGKRFKYIPIFEFVYYPMYTIIIKLVQAIITEFV